MPNSHESYEITVCGLSAERLAKHLEPIDSHAIASPIGGHYRITCDGIPDREEFLFSFGQSLVSDSGEDLSSVVLNLLNKRGIKVAVAETFSAGELVNSISAAIALNVSASSDEIKINVLSCRPEMIEKFGSVSSQVTAAMAIGAMRMSDAQIGFSVNGNADVTYVGLCDSHGLWVLKLTDECACFTCDYALDFLRRYLSYTDFHAPLYKGSDEYCVTPWESSEETLFPLTTLATPLESFLNVIDDEDKSDNEAVIPLALEPDTELNSIEDDALPDDTVFLEADEDDDYEIITADTVASDIAEIPIGVAVEEAVSEADLSELGNSNDDLTDETEYIDVDLDMTDEISDLEYTAARKEQKVKLREAKRNERKLRKQSEAEKEPQKGIKAFIPLVGDSLPELIRKFAVIVLCIAVIAGSAVLITSLVSASKAKSASDRVSVIYEKALAEPYPNGVTDSSGVMNKFLPLVAENPDTIGWIGNGSKDIFSPVLRSDASYFYSDRDFFGEKSVAGSVYTDAACVPQKGSSARNTVIYGRDDAEGAVFGNLDKYRDMHYFVTSPEIAFDTLWACGRYAVIAAVDADGSSDSYRRTDFSSDSELLAYVDEMRSASLYTTNVPAGPDSELLTLVSDHGSGRFVLVLRKLVDNEVIKYSAHIETGNK